MTHDELQRIARLEAIMERVEAKLDRQDTRTDARLDGIEGRLAMLESAVGAHSSVWKALGALLALSGTIVLLIDRAITWIVK